MSTNVFKSVTTIFLFLIITMPDYNYGIFKVLFTLEVSLLRSVYLDWSSVQNWVMWHFDYELISILYTYDS